MVLKEQIPENPFYSKRERIRAFCYLLPYTHVWGERDIKRDALKGISINLKSDGTTYVGHIRVPQYSKELLTEFRSSSFWRLKRMVYDKGRIPLGLVGLKPPMGPSG